MALKVARSSDQSSQVADLHTIVAALGAL